MALYLHYHPYVGPKNGIGEFVNKPGENCCPVYESEDLHGMWIETWLVITKDQKETSVSFSYLSELRKEEILGFERDFTFKERHNVIPKHPRWLSIPKEDYEKIEKELENH